MYRAGPRQHEESSLDVNALGAARNHIRHEQAALPREFTSAGLRFRHGAIVTTDDNERGESRRWSDRSLELQIIHIHVQRERKRGRERGSCRGNFDANYYLVPYRWSPQLRDARTSIDWSLRRKLFPAIRTLSCLSLSQYLIYPPVLWNVSNWLLDLVGR